MPLFNDIINTNGLYKNISSSVYNSLRGYTDQEKNRDAVIARKGRDPIRSYITWASDFKATGSSATGVLGLTRKSSKLVFHVLTSAQHNFTTQVTQYPVEEDVAISDHIQLENPSFSITAMFSDATHHLLERSKESDGSMKQADAYLILQELRDARQTVALRTPLGIYPDLAITSISHAKSTNEGRSLYVDISFQQIRKISTSTTTIDFTVKKTNTVPKATGSIVKNSCAPKIDEGVKPAEVLQVPPLPANAAVDWLKSFSPSKFGN